MTDATQDPRPPQGDQPQGDAALFDPSLIDGLPEAGAIVYGKLWAKDKDGNIIGELTLTTRGFTARQALDHMMDGIAYGKRKYRLSLDNPAKTPQAAPAARPATAANGTPPPPAQPGSIPAQGRPPIPPPPAPPQPPAQPPQGGGTFNICKVEVAPRADGKVDLKFYEANHKYPDIYTARSAEDACTLLAPCGGFVPEHFSAAATYNIACLIDWKPGKTNSRGNPYKDIVTLRAA